MEYVAGPTLRTARAARGPLPASLVAGLGHALALALAAIARAGWVHLDVKPANIVLNARPRLLDFELARPASDGRAHDVADRDVALHAARAARRRQRRPERAVGPAADVFALAVTLGEALDRPTARPLTRRRSRIRAPSAACSPTRSPPRRRSAAADELAAGLSAVAEPAAAIAA